MHLNGDELKKLDTAARDTVSRFASRFTMFRGKIFRLVGGRAVAVIKVSDHKMLYFMHDSLGHWGIKAMTRFVTERN